MLISRLSLWWCLLVGCGCHKTHYDTDMIVNVTLSFAYASDASCIRIVTEEDDHSTFELYKRISKRIEKSTAVFSYEQYIEASKQELTSKTCFKPLKLILDGDGIKDKFTDMSRKVRMARSLWLLILNTSVSDFLSDADISFDVELVVGRVKNKDVMEFWEAYRVGMDYPLRIEEYGTWTKTAGLEIPSSHLYERRSNLEGKTLRAGSIENWPMSSFRDGIWDGYFPRIWKEVAVLINSTVVAYRSRDNATGSKRSDGTWSGLVGMMLDGNLDVIAAEMSMNRARSRVVSFTRPVLITKYKIYFTSTSRLLKWDAVFKPFREDVWVALSIWVIVGTVSMALCYNFSWYHGLDTNTRKVFDVTESFFFVFQSLCQQGYPFMPRSTACRIVIVTCFLVSSVLIPSYSASVISSLTHDSQDKPFNTLKEMVDSGTYKLLVIPNSGQFAHFENSLDPLYQAALEKLIKTVPKEYQVRSIQDALTKAFCKLKQYAFFSTEKIFEMKIQYSPLNCPLVSLSQELSPVYQSLVLKKHSPFKGLINYHLQRLFDIGIINRIELGIRKVQTPNFSPIFSDVDVEDAFQIFALLTCGIALSAVLFLSEKVHSRWSRRKDVDAERSVRQQKHTKSLRNNQPIRLDFYVG